MDVFIFTAITKEQKLSFVPNVPYGFEDPDAAPYFKAAGFGDFAPSGTDPVQVITIEEVDIDPCVMWADGPNKHKFVMPDRAAAHRGSTVEEAEAWKWDGLEDPRRPGEAFVPVVTVVEN